MILKDIFKVPCSNIFFDMWFYDKLILVTIKCLSSNNVLLYILSLAFQDVKFPLTLDVYELCRPELQQKLIPMRDRFKIMDDKKLEEEKVHFYCRKLRMDRDSTSLKNTSKTSMFGAKPFVGNSLVTSQRKART